MEEKFFLVQIKHTSGVYEKGVVVKDSLTAALQSFHAYFGAYGYDHDANTDYVQCAVLDISGLVRKSEVDDRREQVPPNVDDSEQVEE